MRLRVPPRRRPHAVAPRCRGAPAARCSPLGDAQRPASEDATARPVIGAAGTL